MRKLTNDEYNLVIFLLEDKPGTQQIVDNLHLREVEEIDDGGMGSLRFVSNDGTERKFGKEIAEFSLKDLDGMMVSFAIFFDEEGDIFELDIFKADFSPLIQFPSPPYTKP